MTYIIFKVIKIKAKSLIYKVYVRRSVYKLAIAHFICTILYREKIKHYKKTKKSYNPIFFQYFEDSLLEKCPQCLRWIPGECPTVLVPVEPWDPRMQQRVPQRRRRVTKANLFKSDPSRT